ncbi:MAG TPA: GTP-binding protein [Acetobacteraceae bacterium]|nr:GTP-binding protein [Acetobacteraceae bacterium]
MARVRAELGPDALILSTRRVADGVEITAALEPAAERIADDPARLSALDYHGVPAALRGKLRHGALESALAATFGFAELPLDGSHPLLLAGPPGAGKTLTVARLATRLVMAGIKPLTITADGKRAGATEQLAAFTRLLGIELVVANNPVLLGRALMRRQPGVPVLIDAPGLDPFDATQRDELAALAATADAVTVLVLAGGQQPDEAGELGAAYGELGATLMIATRLDLTRRLGGTLAAAHGGRLTLAEAGIGPGAADGLVPLTPAFLATRLLILGSRA